MCDRYVLPDPVSAEREFYPTQAWWNFDVKFNVAPQQYVPAIRIHGSESQGMMMRWGLIPSSAETQQTGAVRACVEIDRLERSSTYKALWLNSQRCILPVSGFYAWQLTKENYRQPYFVSLPKRTVFGLAAVWDRWNSEDDDDVVESCSIIRVPANSLLNAIAVSDGRMPAILRRKDYMTWLSGTPAQAKATLHSYNPEWMQAYPVSPRINSTEPDDAGLIQPVE
jgi:putative SOS response-associated peptidase YedK